MNAIKGLQTGTAPIEGADLYYEIAGEGPSLVLAHAGFVDRRMWDDQFLVFAQHYRHPHALPNNSFKPNLLRYTDNVAGKACHVVGYATQVGLTQQLS